MMNLLSQLIQKSGAQGLNVKPAATASDSAPGAQEKSSKFTRMVMGLLGMGDETSETPVSLQNGKKEKNGIQVHSQTSSAKDGEGKNREGPLDLFIGESLPMAENMIGAQVVTKQSLSPNGHEAQGASGTANKTNMDGEQKSIPKLLFAGGEGAKVGNKKTANADKLNLPASTLTGEGEQKNLRKGSHIPNGAKGEVSNNGKGNLTITDGSVKLTSEQARTQPGSNSTEAKLTSRKSSTETGLTQKVPFKASSNLDQSILSSSNKEGKVQLAMAESKKGQQKVSAFTTTAMQRGSDTEAAGIKPVQKDPALKHLIQQAEIFDSKTVAKETRLQSSASAKGETLQNSAGRSSNVPTNLVQSLAAGQQDKVLFKPLQQSDASFELDPSKLKKVENGNTQDVEMELQAQSDKDAANSDDGKSPHKMSGVTVSQMSKSSGRREFSVQLVRHLQQQSETTKSGSANRWSHHRLVMDDGQALNVSVRQADGAMHLQLSAGNSELNKIIQQHIDEIRQHLQEQMNVEVNLQFQQFGNQEAGSEGNNTSAQKEFGGGFSQEGRDSSNSEATAGRTTRYLGFNNNEWTA